MSISLWRLIRAAHFAYATGVPAAATDGTRIAETREQRERRLEMGSTELAIAGVVRRPRLETFLVPHDLSEWSMPALRLAGELAHCTGATLHLMYAIASAGLAWSAAEPIWLSEFADATAVQRDSCRRTLQEAAEREGVGARIHLVIGPPARAICALAREIDADLIVMTSRRRSAWEHALRCGVLAHALRYAPCPVLNIFKAEGLVGV
jgi:nucleotide-binding universal stress UspA family protein